MIILDNATYHTNSNVQDYMVRNQINYMYTGPRSYDFNAIEAIWALLKMKDMNPDNVPIGKKYVLILNPNTSLDLFRT